MSRFEEPFNDDEESLAEGCTKDLLEGYGASEDHQTFIAALRAGGLSEATAKEVHRRTMTHPEAPNMKTIAAPTQAPMQPNPASVWSEGYKAGAADQRALSDAHRQAADNDQMQYKLPPTTPNPYPAAAADAKESGRG